MKISLSLGLMLVQTHVKLGSGFAPAALRPVDAGGYQREGARVHYTINILHDLPILAVCSLAQVLVWYVVSALNTAIRWLATKPIPVLRGLEALLPAGLYFSAWLVGLRAPDPLSAYKSAPEIAEYVQPKTPFFCSIVLLQRLNNASVVREALVKMKPKI
jgi:hypothetical protein